MKVTTAGNRVRACHSSLWFGDGAELVHHRRQLAGHQLSVALVESRRDVGDVTSKANTAILHTGFDAPPGSLELDCMRSGRAEYLEIRAHLNLPLLESSALVVGC